MSMRAIVRTTSFCALLVIASTVAWADNAVMNFSSVSNPNGHWSYGMTPTLGGTFFFLPSGSCGALAGWAGSSTGTPPFILGNSTGVPQLCGTGLDPSNLLDMHPGPNGEYSDVRWTWTAFSAGTIDISGLFEGIDPIGPTTTDVHILLNNVSIFNGVISSYNIPLPFSKVGEPVTFGSTVDFVVGWGADGSFLFDSTGFDATITASATPEPTSILLLAPGVGVLGLAFRRKWLHEYR